MLYLGLRDQEEMNRAASGTLASKLSQFRQFKNSICVQL